MGYGQICMILGNGRQVSIEKLDFQILTHEIAGRRIWGNSCAGETTRCGTRNRSKTHVCGKEKGNRQKELGKRRSGGDCHGDGDGGTRVF
jgi:hypothetical protein